MPKGNKQASLKEIAADNGQLLTVVDQLCLEIRENSAKLNELLAAVRSGLISLRGRSISWPASQQSMDFLRSGRARPSGTGEELLCDPRKAKSRMGENVAPTPSSPASSAGLTTGYPNCAHPRPLHQPSQWPPIRLTPPNLPATPAKGRCTIQHQEDRLTECGQGTLLGPNMITGAGPGSVPTPTQVPDHNALPLDPATR